MNEFQYRDGRLHAENLPVSELAARYGTPLYIYSRGHLRSQFRALQEAMQELDPLICFAVKSNSNAAVINVFAREGAGADVVSAGEIHRAKGAGIPASRMVFAGVGKTEQEIEYALREDILSFTVESEPELERISAVGQALGLTGRVDIRVNPDVDPKTHKYTSTGKKENKFGVDLERALRAYELAADLPHVEIAGMHMHIGSPVMTIGPYQEALEKVVPICRELKERYPTFQHLDIGGGLGIPYRPDDTPFDLQSYAQIMVNGLKDLDLKILLEPGRFLTGNAGILVSEVQFVKENPFKKFVIIDAAMNDLIRPALYQAYHHVIPVHHTAETLFGDLVGPVCESGDFLAQNRELPAVEPGGLLAIEGAGAYAFAMASTYNSRGRPAEVMVSGDRAEQVRERESWDDLVRGESQPEW
jgi:diaminopimelate decarboxylase